MFRTSKLTLPAVPSLCAAALLCATVASGPNPAAAQTAGDLKCRKCVNTRDLDRGAVTRSRLKNNAVNFRKLHPTVEEAVKQDRTFSATMDSNGAEATLVTQGPLRLFARCFIDDGGEDRIEVLYISTVDGWFVGDSEGRRDSGEVVGVDGGNFSVPHGTEDYLERPVPGAIAPDGSTIGPVPLLSFGFNIFGDVCQVHGRASVNRGTP